MPDISMCQDNSCPSRRSCYRFIATPSPYQCYADFKHEGEKCEKFIEAISKSQIRRLDSQTK